MAYGLFLDDDPDRHARFRARVDVLRQLRYERILYVYSAAGAIDALRAHEGEIAEAFLDHDLCVEDQCVPPGAPSKLPTGMVVVDHILTMRQPPAVITVHSFNYDAAMVMCSRLASLRSVSVKHIPFHELLDQLR